MVAKPTRTKASLPITRHPLFPVMVGLWFAALFGLGSLAIRPTLIEKFVLDLRIDLIVPAAAPPLGVTARILLALVLFVVGGVIGIVLARRIAKGKKAPVSVRTMAPTIKRAYAEVADDEDLERLAAARNAPHANAIPGRRRALAMEEDFSNQIRDAAPIPGGAPQILDLADLGPMHEADYEPEAAFPELADEADSQYAPFAQPDATQCVEASEEAVIDEADVPAPVAEPEPLPEASFDPWNRHAPIPDPVETANEQDFEAEVSAEIEAPAPFAAPAAIAERPFEAPAAIEATSEPALGPEPVAFAEPSHGPAVDAAQFAPLDEGAEAADPASQPVMREAEALAAVRLGQISSNVAADLRSVSVDSLGVVQLAERLAMAISRRREAASALAPAVAAPSVPQLVTPPPLPSPGPFTGLAPTLEDIPSAPVFAPTLAEMPSAPAEEPVAAAPIAPPAIPAGLRPMSFEEVDEPLEMVLPPRNFAMSVAPLAEPEMSSIEEASEPVANAQDDEEDGAYGSLLGIMPAARQTFVRIDEPEEDFAETEPVVIFPGQSAQVAPFAAPGGLFSAPAPVAAAPLAATAPLEPGHRFDIPPVPAAQAAPAAARSVDAEDTERALKAALATLQRMSGAA